MKYYTPKITLIDKTTNAVTPVSIEGDTTGDLLQYRSSGKYIDTIGTRPKHGTLTLRSQNGIQFIKKEPILVDARAKDRFLIDVQLFQPNADFSSETGEKGTHFRFEITNATVQNGKNGIHIALELTGWERRLGEVLDSDTHRLLTPKESFLKRLTCYSLFKGANAPLIFYVDTGDTAINLPDTPNLKQDYIPRRPRPIKSLLDDIIKKISRPEYIGTTNEDYYYYFVTNPNFTKSFQVVARPLGEVDSGVVIDDTESADGVVVSTERNSIYDSRKYKNIVVAKGPPATHHLPLEFTKWASDWNHATLVPINWVVGTVYTAGDYVKKSNNYYKCIVGHTSSSSDGVFLSKPKWDNLTTAVRQTPWTLDTKTWIASMCDHKNPPAGYVGLFNDFNLTRPNFDRADETDEYENVSMKSVEAFVIRESDIEAGAIQHGRRYLINRGEGKFAGHGNQVAQYDETINGWRFSKNPVLGDIVCLESTAQVLRFDGGLWDTIWSTTVNVGRASPFHIVKSVTLTKDYRDTPNKAIEFRYDWNAISTAEIEDVVNKIIQIFISRFTLSLKIVNIDISKIIFDTAANLLTKIGITKTQLENAIGLGDEKNKTSRVNGFTMKFPLPRNKITGGKNIGEFIKQSCFDFRNLTTTATGKSGWNQGGGSEDLGNITGIEFWAKSLFADKANNKITGVANMPYVYYFRDVFDRVVFGATTIPVNGEWHKVKIPCGFNSKLQLFDSRIDELFKLFGYTFPHNFFLKEREQTGVKFQWGKVVEFGFWYKNSYDENYFYKGAQDSFFDSFVEQTTQKLSNLAVFTGGIVDVPTLIINHATFAITDFHFVKDSYVLNTDSVTDDNRQILVETDESDYYNMKSIAEKTESRVGFSPETHVLETRGNVKLKPGEKFVRKGSGIPGGTQELVAIEIQHIDSDKYDCVVTAVKRFVV